MMLGGILLGAVGVLFLVVGAITGIRLRRFLGSAVEIQGKVVGFEEQVSTDSDGDRTSSTHAKVEFETASGQKMIFTEKSQTLGGLAVGSAVPVKYDPAAPRKARIATGGRLWLSTIVLVALGAVLVIVGVIVGLSGG
jgi:hypothetical protein